jgi:hypothetical protein
MNEKEEKKKKKGSERLFRILNSPSPRREMISATSGISRHQGLYSTSNSGQK